MYRLWCRLRRSDVSERSCDSHNDRRERSSAGQCDHTGAAAGSDRYGHSYAYADPYTNAHTNAITHIYADAYAVSHPHPQAGADPYTRADAYSDTDPNEVRYGYQPESA
jgi:hypothetical protein